MCKIWCFIADKFRNHPWRSGSVTSILTMVLGIVGVFRCDIWCSIADTFRNNPWLSGIVTSIFTTSLGIVGLLVRNRLRLRAQIAAYTVDATKEVFEHLGQLREDAEVVIHWFRVDQRVGLGMDGDVAARVVDNLIGLRSKFTRNERFLPESLARNMAQVFDCHTRLVGTLTYNKPFPELTKKLISSTSQPERLFVESGRFDQRANTLLTTLPLIETEYRRFVESRR